MIEMSVQDAETRLSDLLDLVQSGEDVITHRDGKPVARLAAVEPARRPPFGAMRGEFELPEDWDRSPTREEAEAFWKGEW